MQVASLYDRIHPSPFWGCHDREQTIPHNPSFNHPQANAPSTPSHSFLNHNGETPPPFSFSAQQMHGYSYRNQQSRHPHTVWLPSVASLLVSRTFQRNVRGSFLPHIFIFCIQLNTHTHIIIISIQPEGRIWQEPEPSQATGMALAHCILGSFLGVGCHCFPPPLDVPTFASRCLHVQATWETSISGRRNYGREMAGQFCLWFRLPRKWL